MEYPGARRMAAECAIWSQWGKQLLVVFQGFQSSGALLALHYTQVITSVRQAH
jgi:hypothetical protein